MDIGLVINKADALFNKFVGLLVNEEEAEPTYQIDVPRNIYLRTELICNYVKDSGYDFEIENFLMLLYLDYVKFYIKSCDPLKACRELQKRTICNDSLIIQDNGKKYNVSNINNSYTRIIITMDPNDAKKGLLILDELNYLYGFKMNLGELIAHLWIRFIDDYNITNNKKSCDSVISILKEVLG